MCAHARNILIHEYSQATDWANGIFSCCTDARREDARASNFAGEHV